MCIAHEKIHTEIIYLKKQTRGPEKKNNLMKRGRFSLDAKENVLSFFVVVDNFPIDVTSLKTTFVDGLRKRRIKNNAESRGSA